MWRTKNGIAAVRRDSDTRPVLVGEQRQRLAVGVDGLGRSQRGAQHVGGAQRQVLRNAVGSLRRYRLAVRPTKPPRPSSSSLSPARSVCSRPGVTPLHAVGRRIPSGCSCPGPSHEVQHPFALSDGHRMGGVVGALQEPHPRGEVSWNPAGPASAASKQVEKRLADGLSGAAIPGGDAGRDREVGAGPLRIARSSFQCRGCSSASVIIERRSRGG